MAANYSFVRRLNMLPAEILVNIFGYLSAREIGYHNLSTLVALTWAGPHIKAAAAEVLCASYNYDYSRPFLFLRSLIAQPGLAKHVKHLDFNTGLPDTSHQNAPNDQDKQALTKVLSTLPISQEERTTMAASISQHETFKSAILVLTYRLTSLTFNMDDLDCSSFAWFAPSAPNQLTTIHDRTRHFETLTSIALHFNDTTNFGVEDIVHFLQLPKVQKLRLHGLYDSYRRKGYVDQVLKPLIPQGHNNIQEIWLDECEIELDIIGFMVSTAANLVSFSYKLCHEPDTASTVELLSCLNCQSKTLKYLSIWCNYHTERFPEAFNLASKLQEFQVLEQLHCPFECVFNPDLDAYSQAILPRYFPSSITTFNVLIPLVTYGYGVLFTSYHGFGSAAARFKDHTPKLKRITMCASKSDHWLTRNQLGLIRRYYESGIALVRDPPLTEDDF
ncbi:hypothetical protein GQ44DRAFT_803100 [Phaeosphaeriaceae sp. PMI808]|nr:hypothetical protein GQ44DRAFT_803100 [Phaeosphaeriaceae sp. PMI808]